MFFFLNFTFAGILENYFGPNLFTHWWCAFLCEGLNIFKWLKCPLIAVEYLERLVLELKIFFKREKILRIEWNL